MKRIKKGFLVLGACMLAVSCSDKVDNQGVTTETTTKMMSLDFTMPVPETVTNNTKAIVSPAGDGEVKWEGTDYVTALPYGTINKYNLYIETPSLYDDDMSQLIGRIPGTQTRNTVTNETENLVSFYLYYPMDTESENDPIEVGMEGTTQVLYINYPVSSTFSINTDQDNILSFYESTQQYGEIQPFVSGGVQDLLISEDGLKSLDENVRIDFYPFNVQTTFQITTSGLSQDVIDRLNALECDMVVGSIEAVDANGRQLEHGPFFTQLSIDVERVTTENGIKLSDIETFLAPTYSNGLSYVESVIKYTDANGAPRLTTLAERVVSEPNQPSTLYLPIFTSPVMDELVTAGGSFVFKATFYTGDEVVLTVSRTINASLMSAWPVGTFNTISMSGHNNTVFDFTRYTPAQ